MSLPLRLTPVRFTTAAVTVTALLLAVTATHAGPTPAQQCQAGKNKAAGKYATCRENAAATLAASGDPTKYGAAITKCGVRLTSAWQKATDKARAAGATCLEDPLTAGDFQTVIDAHTNNVATALGGGGLTDCPADLAMCEGGLAILEACGNGTVEAPEQCDAANLGGATCATQGFAVGTLRCASACTFDTSGCYATRYVDNGNGTVTDHQTGLQWEKKTTTWASGRNYADPHDVDNPYTWTVNVPGPPDDIASLLATLNNCVSSDGSTQTGGFAGHCDWRLPTITELQTITLLTPSACAIFSCIDPVFGPTARDGYWSVTSDEILPGYGWFVDFFDGRASIAEKIYSYYYVRAVRTGS